MKAVATAVATTDAAPASTMTCPGASVSASAPAPAAATPALDMALGSVGGHLAVLCDAGLVDRVRVGRSVRYERMALGEALAADRTSGSTR